MCCYATKKNTQKVRSEMQARGGKMSFWKAISTTTRSLLHNEYKWKKGINKMGNTNLDPSSYAKLCNDNDYKIDHGLHVFLTKEDAIKEVYSWAYSSVCLIEVEADEKNLIGADIDTAVFTELNVTPRMWKSYRERCRKLEKKLSDLW